MAGALILALSLYWLPRVGSVSGFLGSCALMALGNGLLTPTLAGMASRFVSESAQGRVMGLMSAAGSLARFLGPSLAVLSFPANFSELGRPLGAEVLEGVRLCYEKAFSFGALLVALSLVCIGFLATPKEQKPV
jgi:MFS family permease